MWHKKLTFAKFHINYLDLCIYTLLFIVFCEALIENTQEKYE